ncbi:MAG: AAA family ATPase [Candidatus Altiarchaeota archaeon]
MLSEVNLFKALPEGEVKVSELAKALKVRDNARILEVALRLQRKGCVRIRKPLFREHRILKIRSDCPRSKCKTIAVINLKGGVGKTITTVNLSACLAQAGHRTLIVDLDPQANATSVLGVEPKATVYGVLVGSVTVKDAVYNTKYPNLDLIPSELNLAGAEVELMGTEGVYRLKEVVDELKDTYRFIVVDCPPSLSLLSMNALAAADSIIVPVQCDQFALKSIEKLMETMKLLAEVNKKLYVEGILITSYEAGNELCVETAKSIRETYGDILYDTMINRDATLSEASSHGTPIIHYRADSDSAKSYTRLSEGVASDGK